MHLLVARLCDRLGGRPFGKLERIPVRIVYPCPQTASIRPFDQGARQRMSLALQDLAVLAKVADVDGDMGVEGECLRSCSIPVFDQFEIWRGCWCAKANQCGSPLSALSSLFQCHSHEACVEIDRSIKVRYRQHDVVDPKAKPMDGAALVHAISFPLRYWPEVLYAIFSSAEPTSKIAISYNDYESG